MSANAFGGHHRIDKCNLQGPSLLGGVEYDVVSNTPGERTLWVNVIADSVNSYLIFGLGRNGSVASEFFYACEFLFNVRAFKPETWLPARIMRDTYVDEQSGRCVTRVQEIPDALLKATCLDSLWDSLRFAMPLDTFTNRLQAERRQILWRNWSQVSRYLNLNQSFASCEAALICPSTPEELTGLLYSSRISGLAVAA